MAMFQPVIVLIIILFIGGCSSDKPNEIIDPPPPVTETRQPIPIVDFTDKISRLQIFARVATSIEFFHPGDGAYATDWDKFIVYGMYQIATTESEDEFVAKMQSLFAELAPSVRFNESNYQGPSFDSTEQVIAWHQSGYKDRLENGRSVYSSMRRTLAYADLKNDPSFAEESVYHIDYGNLVMDMPLVLSSDANSSHPGNAFADSNEWIIPTTLANPYVCLATFSKVWAGIQNYWPYFDSIEVDWLAELSPLLSSCAAQNRTASMAALELALTKLQDNHIYYIANYAAFPFYRTVPLGFEWVENKVTTVYKRTGAPNTVSIGDELVAIDGVDVMNVIEQFKPYSLKSETKQINFAILLYMIRRQSAEQVELTLRDQNEQGYTLNILSDSSLYDSYFGAINAYRPMPTEQHRELANNIHYVDLSITQESMVDQTIESLADASAIVLDFRNYPEDWHGWRNTLAHFSSQPISAPPMYNHWVGAPDRSDVERVLIPQFIQPRTPLLDIPVIVLASRYSQSQNEHALAYIQNAGLPIMGEATSGINGNVTRLNTFGGSDNGGLTLVFTGLEVTQNDHTTHIGVGILPDIIVERTIESLRNGEDNQLAQAVEYLQAKLEVNKSLVN